MGDDISVGTRLEIGNRKNCVTFTLDLPILLRPVYVIDRKPAAFDQPAGNGS